MKPGGGKAKGNGFEGQIAKKLSVALQPLNFIRSPGSGARVGGKNFEKFGDMFGEDALKLFTADVVPINERKTGLNFLHSIECKSYKTPDNFTSLVSGTANVFKWFKESEEDANKIGKNPILIFKWNNTPIFVAIDESNPRCPKIGRPELLISSKKNNEGPGGARYLHIYLFDELVKDSSFWYSSVV